MAIESWERDQHKSKIKYNLQNELGVFVASCLDYLSYTIIQDVGVSKILSVGSLWRLQLSSKLYVNGMSTKNTRILMKT